MPGVGDLTDLTNVKPKCFDDLNEPQQSFLAAYVHGIRQKNFSKLTSKPIEDEEGWRKKETFFAVYLTNLTTNLRL